MWLAAEHRHEPQDRQRMQAPRIDSRLEAVEASSLRVLPPTPVPTMAAVRSLEETVEAQSAL